jgi:hypothetical protein
LATSPLLVNARTRASIPSAQFVGVAPARSDTHCRASAKRASSPVLEAASANSAVIIVPYPITSRWNTRQAASSAVPCRPRPLFSTALA